MRRQVIQRTGAWLAAMCIAGIAMAADPLVGSPPVQRFAPDIEAHPQNFSVAQDRDGIVYLGNQEGVLEYDGEAWRLLPLPNGEIVRTLVAAGDGRVYVGGYDSFGFLERDPTGKLVFRELADRFAAQTAGREFADIWDILVAPEGVYFRAVRDVFFWDPAGKAPDAHWRHEGRFGAIAHHDGATWLQFRGEGFRRRTPQGWVLAPETAPLQTLVYDLVPVDGGGLLTTGSDGAWWLWKEGALAPAAMPAGMPPSSHFENSLRLGDDSLAFATRDGVVYLVAPDRRSERHFRIAPDFLTDIAPSVDGGFLLPGDEAFYRVAWPSAWSVLGAEHGAEGSVNGLSTWEGRRYLMTSSGAHEVLREAGGSMRFGPDPWEPLSAYDLHGIGPGRALLARAHKLLLVEDGRTRELSPELVYPRLFVRSRHHPGRVYVGTEVGLRTVALDGARVALSGPLEVGEAMRVSSVAETADDEAWVGTDRDGLWRYRFAPDGTLASRERFGDEQGVRTGRIAEAWVERLADGVLVASTREGWFRREGEAFVEDKFGNLAQLRRPGELLRVVQAPDGGLWAYGVTRVLRRDGQGAWREMDIGGVRRGGLVGHSFEADGRVVFVAGQGLMLQEPPAAHAPVAMPGVALRSALLVQPDGTRVPQSLARTEPVRLPPGEYGIRFEFALPDMARHGAHRYRGRLVPYEQEFSEWSHSHGYTYSRLRPGDYRFELEAIDSRGQVTAIPPLRVRVEPRWYATRTARMVTAVVLLVLMWIVVAAIIRLRTQRLAAQKQALEEVVARRTSELAEANRRLEMMAHIDGLTGIPNRRRLDEYLAIVWQQCEERRRPLSLLAIDVDRFKDFNDRRGHLAGDELLRQLADRLAFCLRRSEDLLARYGGEEFLVVMPGADLAIAATLAEKMRHEIEASGLGITISIGVSSRVPDEHASLTDLVARADAALYIAKKGGRNRVELAKATAEAPAH